MAHRLGNPALSVDFVTRFDNVADGITKSGRVCLDMEALSSGLIAEIGANRLGILLVILNHMDAEGNSFPSQRRIADLTGQSVPTVNKIIKELLEIEFGGQKLLRREFVEKGGRKYTVYHIHNGTVTNTDTLDFSEADPAEEEKVMNCRDVAIYFGQVYEETFGKGYIISWQRELALLKSKFIPAYKDNETMRAVIDVAVGQYSERWANGKYQTPTISMLTTWLGNEAYSIVMQDGKKEVEQSERISTATDSDETDIALELF